ncbi:MAG: hypothetical protein D6695_08855 [Planctomycetota bacterium]|nr:MAG: hypothetical protein D6695_08855 [Planctomycetota bacterium]
MLKFIRKYQLIMLAIGGSLLMVVFLIGPIVQQIGPTLADKTVATMDGGTRKVSIYDRQRAAQEPKIISDVFPFMFGQPSMGLPGLIQLDPKEPTDHWILLKTEAQDAGLVGESEDGRRWLEEDLAQVFAIYEKQFEILRDYGGNMQIANFLMSQPQTQQAIAERTTALRTELPTRARQIAGRMGLPETEVYKMLAEARGVSRLMSRHERAIRPSEREVIEAIKDAHDEAVVDFVLIPASRLVDKDLQPTDEQLKAQFERFRDSLPGQGELGYGYTLPPRVKLGWLTLDREAIASIIRPDRVEVRKRYSENRTRFPGEFEDERAKVEAEIIDEQVRDLMIDADRIIQGRLRAALKDVPQDADGYYQIPEHWGAVTMESLSEAVVQEMRDQREIEFPQPGITYRVDKWFTSEDLSLLPGIGRSYWQVGPERIEFSRLTSLARSLGGSKKVRAQIRIPIAEPPAVDPDGNRYYVVLFETRPQSPPDSWEELREQLASDYRELSAYEALTRQTEELASLARAEGLQAVAARFNSADEESAQNADGPRERNLYVSKWARVRKGGMGRIDVNKPVDAQAETQAFYDAVLARAVKLDPMTPFGEHPPEDSVFAVALPAEQAVVVVHILAYRPATVDARYRFSRNDMVALSQRQFRSLENLAENIPFSLDAMIKRHDYKLKSRGEEEEEEFDN